MTALIVIACWLALGGLGSYLTLRHWWEYDITIGEIVMGALFALLGPLNLISAGILLLGRWAEPHLDRVVVKREWRP